MNLWITRTHMRRCNLKVINDRRNLYMTTDDGLKLATTDNPIKVGPKMQCNLTAISLAGSTDSLYVDCVVG